jgi:hypothetical protein
VHLVFGPLRRAHIRQEHAEKALALSLAQRLESIPPERRIEADPMITGPAILESQFVIHHKALREMYARLIASAADSAVVTSAHPAFVSFIRQMTPDEAKLLTHFRTERMLERLVFNFKDSHDNVILLRGQYQNLTCPENLDAYITNLKRLGLISVTRNTASWSQDGKLLARDSVELTSLGWQFCRVCMD